MNSYGSVSSGYMPIIRAIQPTAGSLERSEFGQNPSTRLNTGNTGKYLCREPCTEDKIEILLRSLGCTLAYSSACQQEDSREEYPCGT